MAKPITTIILPSAGGYYTENRDGNFDDDVVRMFGNDLITFGRKYNGACRTFIEVARDDPGFCQGYRYKSIAPSDVAQYNFVNFLRSYQKVIKRTPYDPKSFGSWDTESLAKQKIGSSIGGKFGIRCRPASRDKKFCELIRSKKGDLPETLRKFLAYLDRICVLPS
jgi:hypothetical protein